MATRTRREQNVFGDERTARSIGVVVLVLLILMALIGVLTFIPVNAITSGAEQQSAERQQLLAASLARQIEAYFNELANDLVDLAGRPAIQSIGLRADAVRILNERGTARESQIQAIVRLARDGSVRYVWPDGYAPLWSTDSAWVSEVARAGGVQFTRRSTGSGAAYLLVVPVSTGLNTFEALVFEVDIQRYFQNNFRALDLGTSGQLWVLTVTGTELYAHRPEPEFSGGTAQFLNLTDTTRLPGYPTADRESIVVPVYTAFTQSRGGIGSLALILSRTFEEARLASAQTLRDLALFSFGVIAFVALFGLIIATYLIREGARRRRAETRRATANTLLDISRALNSSLQLDEVLRCILENLGTVLPHDNASVMLLDEEQTSFILVAESASNPERPRTYRVEEIAGARDVMTTRQPAVINDCLNDPRWVKLPGSRVRAWLGAPLRVRDQIVGVLSVDSYTPGRFSEEDTGVALAFADQAGVAIQNARAHQIEIGAYEAELETARAIQNSLLPQESPEVPGLRVAARSVPARVVSGDYYQFIPLPDGRLGLAVGDVTGKGIPAALMMAVITTALRDAITQTPAPAALMQELNARLLPRMKQNHLNSGLLVSVFDPATRCIEIAAGGMLAPYSRNGGGWEEVEVSGYPLGAAPNTSYRAQTVDLNRHDTLVFVTDGIVEAKNARAELFGFDRFEALLGTLPRDADAEQIADRIMEAVRTFQEGGEPADDQTVVVIKRFLPS